MKKDLTPSEAAFEKLYFINKINTAGCNNKPVIYKTLHEAKQILSAPLLWKIVNKLTAKEIQFLTNRIENLQ